MVRRTTEEWIAFAEKKYPNRFGYEKTKYIDSYHKVSIRCLEHDEVFLADPVSFLRSSSSGNFCPICKTNTKLTIDEFFERASERFPILDFSKSEYTNYRSNVVVSCPDHGDFTKQAILVLNGQEDICPGCIKEKDSQRSFDLVKFYTENPDIGAEPGTFYKLKITHKPTKIQFIKIGFTSKTSRQRYERDYDDFDLEVLNEVHTTNLEAAKLELEFKKENKHKRFYLPKYIRFAGRNELYELDGYHQLLSSQVKFIRDSLLVKQNGKCPLCCRYVDMPTLDHYHSKRQEGSGLVRGVLCNTCNRMTGVVENNLARNCIEYSDAPQFLRYLADYIEHKRECYIHPTEKTKSPKLMKSSYNKLVKAVNGKQKVPAYTGKFTKGIEKLFEKYGVEPQFHEPSTGKT
jgi:hypothetical protein